jgi:Zn-dependent peptidase ImmA (M78 family)
MATAMALGHLLLDAPRGLESVHLDSPRAHWPSVARARAFAAMLLMPEQGVEEAIGRGVNEQAVRALSRTYGLGTTAVTWHLKNLGHISEEARVELAASVGAPEG